MRTQQIQRRREVELAVGLVARLLPYVGAVDDSDRNRWRDDMESESKHLADAPFGVEMVSVRVWVRVGVD